MDPAKLREYLEKKCYLDRDTGRPYHWNHARQLLRSFLFTSTGNARTWIPFWSWLASTI